MAMVNPAVLNLAAATNVKDSRWLTLEVCREFQRNKCTRTDTECKFAHPPPHVEVQNGRVTACFDSIKGKCQRKEPPCKYLHPPQHLREQLLQNGRNNLILKNLQIQAAQQAALNQGMVPGLIPISHSSNIAYSSPMAILPRPRPEDSFGQFYSQLSYKTDSFGQLYSQLGYKTAHPYLGGAAPTPTSVAFPPYMNSMPTIAVGGAQTNGESPSLVSHQPGVIPTALQNSTAATKLTRPDRLESQVPGMVGQYKRVAMADAKGLPMYQPISNIGPYQQAIAMQLQQPQYIPVSFAGHPPSVQRF